MRSRIADQDAPSFLDVHRVAGRRRTDGAGDVLPSASVHLELTGPRQLGSDRELAGVAVRVAEVLRTLRRLAPVGVAVGLSGAVRLAPSPIARSPVRGLQMPS